MKFGRKMREQSEDVFDDETIEAALNYKLLKKIISQLKDEGRMEADACKDWLSKFNVEVQKFEEKFKSQLTVVEEEVDKAVEGKNKTALKAAYYDVQELRLFAELNRTGCRKILKKFDKNIPGHDVGVGFSDTQSTLAVVQMQPKLEELSDQVARTYNPEDARVAKMELDYHVSCVSDLFAYILSHSAQAPRDKESTAGPPSLASSPST